MASPVEPLGTIGFLGGIAAAWDNRQSAFVLDLLAHMLAVVGFVGGDSEGRLWRIEHVSNDLTVMDLATGYGEVQWPAFAVDDGVDFRRAAAATDADRLILLPPFAPLAAR